MTFILFFAFLVFCALFTLKVGGTVRWSWWLITLPLWLFALQYAGLLVLFAVLAVGAFYVFTDSAYRRDVYRKVRAYLPDVKVTRK